MIVFQTAHIVGYNREVNKEMYLLAGIEQKASRFEIRLLLARLHCFVFLGILVKGELY